MTEKSVLWWASIGGAKTEPIRVVEENGRKLFYSIGCNDPHEMEGVELIREVGSMPMNKASLAAQAAARARWDTYRGKRGFSLGYRQFE